MDCCRTEEEVWMEAGREGVDLCLFPLVDYPVCPSSTRERGECEETRMLELKSDGERATGGSRKMGRWS